MFGQPEEGHLGARTEKSHDACFSNDRCFINLNAWSSKARGSKGSWCRGDWDVISIFM